MTWAPTPAWQSRERPGQTAERAEVTMVSPVSRVLVPAVGVLVARGCVRLYSRPHIDLQRVAGALCCR
ncbi:putative leader peptide [Streptomyces sp. NPDC058685]|uniref:putative leader peptide n=1 Tax=Streptomyces sp. NPDC058685 TaxID=3346598 RepID=UPI00364C7401